MAGSITEIVEKLVPDKELQDQLKVELVKALNNGTIEMKKLEVETSKSEAKIRLAVLERFSIPAVIYVFLFIFINNIIIAPYINAYFHLNIPILQIPKEIYDLMQWIILGVMGKKSVDSVTKRVL